ncbi:TetR/AcrR family transcriptional regulator [Rhodopseudomonas sp. P2A-2r]|uniref:TetR/AcrR family transcriptional regulator n=1 Tax=Rhodopseudomonas sp. P2A-2r TaxID=2991972 RepID=UPI002233EAEF|nr:TetR/AcrR family transcriptional regulator [Rhodopseudomonas sp. P2A-2r]UZE51446.1 TetR/AcrR family transcriptional regulator [Rhodopseudomonas sp. P2A-2r]
MNKVGPKKRRPVRSVDIRSGDTAATAKSARATAPRTEASRSPSNRAAKAAERRAAIIAAGLDEFVARGFAATRLDDVARRAGVAKGTIYLYFTDKEALFQELVRSALVPLIARMAAPPVAGVSARAMVESFAETFVRDIAETKRGDILRLIIGEGARFPSLSEFYYREVVSRGIAGMQQLIDYGIARGEIRNPALRDFPQLVVAPAMLAVIWQGLFGKHAPLDPLAMLRVHIDLIFGERRTT